LTTGLRRKVFNAGFEDALPHRKPAQPRSRKLYRFRYRGSDHTLYVGVMAQEVQKIQPSAVLQDHSGYFVVDYNRIGVKFMTWKEWLARTGKPSSP
jgi:hypothetical protein